MAIKTISQFPPGTPTDNDYILFEQNGEGKSTTIGDAVNTCSLSYGEIMATTTDLTNKVASAEALKEIAKLDLLWTNASPTSAFDRQTISLDVSKYKYFLISVKNNINSNEERYMNVVLKNVHNRIIGIDTLGIVVRIDTHVTESGISFSNGYPVNSEVVNNDYAIPYQIYGVK